MLWVGIDITFLVLPTNWAIDVSVPVATPTPTDWFGLK